jgi:hypothetical protein
MNAPEHDHLTAIKTGAASAAAGTSAGLSFIEALEIGLRLGCMAITCVAGILSIYFALKKRKEEKARREIKK